MTGLKIKRGRNFIRWVRFATTRAACPLEHMCAHGGVTARRNSARFRRLALAPLAMGHPARADKLPFPG